MRVKYLAQEHNTMFILLGGERHCESKVSCPRTQHSDPGQGSNPMLSFDELLMSLRRQAGDVERWWVTARK